MPDSCVCPLVSHSQTKLDSEGCFSLLRMAHLLQPSCKLQIPLHLFVGQVEDRQSESDLSPAFATQCSLGFQVHVARCGFIFVILKVLLAGSYGLMTTVCAEISPLD